MCTQIYRWVYYIHISIYIYVRTTYKSYIHIMMYMYICIHIFHCSAYFCIRKSERFNFTFQRFHHRMWQVKEARWYRDVIYIYTNIYSVRITCINVFEKCLFYPFLTSSLPSASLNEASKIHQPTPGHLLGLKHPHCPHWKSWVGPATKHPPTEKSQENSWELQRSPKHVATNMMLFWLLAGVEIWRSCWINFIWFSH